jgi:hypothetical protein
MASLVIGRRGGKSLILALIAAFLSAFYDWSPYLTGGERGTRDPIQRARSQALSALPKNAAPSAPEIDARRGDTLYWLDSAATLS